MEIKTFDKPWITLYHEEGGGEMRPRIPITSFLLITSVLLVLLLGCTFVPPEPIISGFPPSSEAKAAEIRAVVEGTDSSGFTFDFRAWLEPLERRALADFLDDVPGPDNPNSRGAVAPLGEVWGWKGPFNTNGYGIGEWVRTCGHRYPELGPRAFTWLRHHVLRNIYNYWIYHAVKGRGPNEGVAYRWMSDLPPWVREASSLSGIPVETLVHHDGRGWLIPEADRWDGSSYGRHHTYDFVANCAGDSDVPLTGAERELCLVMLEHYAMTRLEGKKLPTVTQRHEWGHYPIRTYVAIYRLFKGMYSGAWQEGDPERDSGGDWVATRRWDLAQRCLRAAEASIWLGWHPHGPGRPRAVQGRDGTWFWAWDASDPDHPHWHGLNTCHTSWPWYVGLRASAWAYLYMEPDCSPWIRDLMSWVIREEARWCSRDWAGLPPLSLAHDDLPGSGSNGWLQGGIGKAGDRWIRQDSTVLTPDEWAALAPDVAYHPLTCIKHRESDNGYYHRFWPNMPGGTTRKHYSRIYVPKNTWPDDFGPRLDIPGSWAGMPDVLFLAGVLEGDAKKVKTAIWMAHDYLAFNNINHSGSTLYKSKGDANPKWYGFNKTRGFAWIAMCGEIMRGVAMDGKLEGLLAAK